MLATHLQRSLLFFFSSSSTTTVWLAKNTGHSFWSASSLAILKERADLGARVKCDPNLLMPIIE